MTGPLSLGLGQLSLTANTGGGGSIFAQQIAKAQAQSRVAKLLVCTHSYGAGFGTGTGINGYIGGQALSYAARIPAKLAARGINVERNGVFGGSNVFNVGGVQPPYNDARLTFGAGWTEDSSGSFTLGAHAWVGAVGGGFADFTPGFTFTSFRVWHLKTTGGNTNVGVYVDGVLVATINQSGTSGIYHTDIVATGSKVSIKNNHGSIPAYMPHAIECFRASQVATWAIASHVSGQVSDLINTGFAWSALYQIQAYQPDLLLLYCMGNEIINGVPAATWKSRVDTLFAQLPDPSAVLVVIEPQLNSPNFFTSLHDDYAAAAMSLTSQYGCRVCDLRPVLGGSFAAASNAGLMYDDLHVNSAGADPIATAIASH